VSLLCILHTTGSSSSIVHALKAIAATIPSQDVIAILHSLLNKVVAADSHTTSSHSTAVTSKGSKSKSKASRKKATTGKTTATGVSMINSSGNNELADVLLQATASDAITAVTLIAEYIQLVTPQQQQQQEQPKKHSSKTSKANSNNNSSNNSDSHTTAVSIDWVLANALFTALHTVSQQLSTVVHSYETSTIESNSSAMVVVASADVNNTTTNATLLPVAVDYCIRALFDALTAIITSTAATTTLTIVTVTATAAAAAVNTRTLVTVLQSGVTTQTRNAGLLLLACMTEALPADTVHDSIHSILQLLSQGVAISDDTYSFKLTQQMIERVLPIIHSTSSSSDSSSGIRVLDVVNTFVTSLLSVTRDNVTAQGKRLALVFSSLLTALSNSALASIGLSLLSHAALQAISSTSSHSSSSIVSTQQQQQFSANAIVNFAHAVCLKCSVSNQIKVLTDMIKATHRLAFEVVDTSNSLALQQTKQVLSDEGSGSHLQFMTSTATTSNSNSGSDSFMMLDMNTLLNSTSDKSGKHALVLMHKQLQFIKEHLAAKALHLQIASDIAAAKGNKASKQHDTAAAAAATAAAATAAALQLQEDFLLLCEELLLLLRTLATCHITDSNSNSNSSNTDTRHNWSAMQKLGHEVILYYLLHILY
jgi:hypothetical protein